MIVIVVGSLVICGLSTVFLLMASRSSAAVRHGIACAGLVALVGFFGLQFWPRTQRVTIAAPPMLARAMSVTAEVPGSTLRVITPGATSTIPKTVKLPLVAMASMAWLFGSLLLISRLGLGLLRCLGWRLTAKTSRSGIRVHTNVPVPLTFGWGKGAVLFPIASSGWSPDRISAAQRHELAHVQRGDWFWNLLGQLAVALYWPIPFVAILYRLAREESERAADDVVLAQGMPPTDYAQHLLEIACDLRGVRAAVSLPMARPHEVSRRVREVLDERRVRRTSSPAIVPATYAAMGLVMIGLAQIALATPPTDSPWQVASADDVSSSWHPDIRNGLTKPGTAANGYTATLRDGRTVQMLQVTMQTPTGSVSFTPDGKLISASKAVPVSLVKKRPELRTLLMRFGPRSRDAEGALGSGRHGTGDYSSMSFSGGGSHVSADGNTCDTQIYIGLYEGATGDHTNFTFTVDDEPWTVEADTPPSGLPIAVSGNVTDLNLKYAATCEPFVRDGKGQVKEDAAGKPITEKVQATRVAFTMPGRDTAIRNVRVKVVRKDGKVEEPFWNDGGYRNGSGPEFDHRWYVHSKPEQIARVVVESRGSMAAEFLGVKLRPVEGADKP